MITNKGKNFLIILFCILAIYQTINLWFFSLSQSYSKSPLTFNSNTANNTKDSIVMQDIYKPYELKYTIDKLNYYVTYSPVTDNNFRQVCDSLIKKSINSGSLISSVHINEVLDSANRIVTYDYTYTLTPKILTDSIQLKSNSFINSTVDFNKIDFVSTINDELYIIYNNESNNTIYKLHDKQLYSAFTELFDNILDYTPNYIYDNGLFVPNVLPNDTYYKLAANNPYSYNGEINYAGLESNVNQFFQYPNNKTRISNSDNKTFGFSDANTIVRYFPNDVFEYNYYKLNNKSDSNSLVDYYVTAVNFISLDTTIINDYYLNSYDYSDNTATFTFNYVINNYPLTMTDAYKDYVLMDAPIEITVQNDVVSSYKKTPFNFSNLETNTSYYKNASYNNIIPEDELNVSKVTLAYKQDQSTIIDLNYFINIDDTYYVTSVSKKE